MSDRARDVAERTLWTALEAAFAAAVAAATTDANVAAVASIPVVAAGIAFVKSFLASKVRGE